MIQDSLREGTHWTHPVYGPSVIHLANQLIEILEKKLEEL